MCSPLKNSRGFTLVEVLVATVILASGLVLIIQNLGRTQQALKISQNLVFAAEIGVNKISSLEMEQQEKTRLSVQHDQGKEMLRGRIFQWESGVVPYQDEGILDETKLNEGHVSVQWQDGPTRQNTLQLKTLFLNRDKESYDTV